MMLWEPAGGEHSGGKSAESVSRARGPGGDGGNTSVTVCEAFQASQLRYLSGGMLICRRERPPVFFCPGGSHLSSHII